MEVPGCWANSTQVTDFFPILVNPKNVGAHTIGDLYLNEGKSAAKIAAEIGLSKAAVLARLHAEGIRRDTIKTVAPDYSRPATRTPFGKRVVAGKLVDCRRELSMARYIIELRARQWLGWNEVVERLNRDGHRTRTGLPWKAGTAMQVFARWNRKV